MAVKDIVVAMESTAQEILENMESGVKALPISRVACVSDNVICTPINSVKSIKSENKTIIATVFVNLDGTVKINASIKSSGNSYYCYLDATVNDTLVRFDSTSTSYATQSKTLEVKKGDFIKFSMWATNSSTTAYCNLITICGDVVDVETDTVVL